MKTTVEKIHVWEQNGLGKALFRFTHYEEKTHTVPGCPPRAGGSCNYCGTGIRHCYWIESADGNKFYVGSSCVEKTGDKGMVKTVKRASRNREYYTKEAIAKQERQRQEYLKKQDEQAQLEKAIRAKIQGVGYAGSVGDKLQVKAVLVEKFCFDGPYGGGDVYKFQVNEQTLVWFTSGKGIDAEEGQEVSISCTVKAHKRRQELVADNDMQVLCMVPQTIITRVKVA